MMKTIIGGDTHMEFGKLNEFIVENSPDVIIICGDFGFWPRYYNDRMPILRNGDTVVYWCDGNHEDHDMLDVEWGKVNRKRVPVEIKHNVFFMPRGTILELANRRILFCGGAESIDRAYRRSGVDWFEQEIITDDDIEAMPDTDITTVISHAAPMFIKEAMGMSRHDMPYGEPFDFPEGSVFGEVGFGRSSFLLEKVFAKYLPQEWYFGHYHKSFHSFQRGCNFRGLNAIPHDGWYVEL